MNDPTDSDATEVRGEATTAGHARAVRVVTGGHTRLPGVDRGSPDQGRVSDESGQTQGLAQLAHGRL